MIWPYPLVCLTSSLLVTTLSFNQIVLEADGYQPYLISPEKGLRSLIKIVLEMAKEPSRLRVDEVSKLYRSALSLITITNFVDLRATQPLPF